MQVMRPDNASVTSGQGRRQHGHRRFDAKCKTVAVAMWLITPGRIATLPYAAVGGQLQLAQNVVYGRKRAASG